MSVTIAPTTQNTYLVNKKEVYEDTSGNWISKEVLSTAERKYFNKYKCAIIDKNKANVTIKFKGDGILD